MSDSNTENNRLRQIVVEADNSRIQHNHNEKMITKAVVSPKSKYALTYSQEDMSFVGWYIHNNSGPLIPDDGVQPYKRSLLRLDFKVSDKKVVMYEDYEARSGNVSFKIFVRDHVSVCIHSVKYEPTHFFFCMQ